MTKYRIKFWDDTEVILETESKPIFDEVSGMWTIGENVYSSVNRIEMMEEGMPQPENILDNIAKEFIHGMKPNPPMGMM